MEHQSIGEFHHSFLLVFLQDEARYLETDDFILNHLAQASDFFGIHDLVPPEILLCAPIVPDGAQPVVPFERDRVGLEEQISPMRPF